MSIDFTPVKQTSPSLLSSLALQIHYKPPSSLHNFGRKARKHSEDQIQSIAESIRTFGFNVPVLVDEADKVIAGNARVEAAILLGLDEVPMVTLSHLTSSQKRAFILAENQLATLAGWDRDILRLELQELRDLDLEFDLEITGFLDSEVDALVLGSHERPNPQSCSLALASPTCAEGDVWLLGEHRVVCQTSASTISNTIVLDGEKARCAFIDAFHSDRGSGKAHDGAHDVACPSVVYGHLDNLSQLVRTLSESLKPGGTGFVSMDWQQIGFLGEISASTDLEILNLVVWDKSDAVAGSFYRSRHELILVLRKAGESDLRRNKRAKPARGRHDVWSFKSEPIFRADDRSMLQRVDKPLALLREAMLDCTAKGDIVIDLTVQAGTAVLAAQETGRRCIAAYQAPLLVDAAIVRWQGHTGGDAILAATGQTFREVRFERGAKETGTHRTSDQAENKQTKPVRAMRTHVRMRPGQIA